MGGPIVRTGTTPAFWANWEKAFGKAAGGAKSVSAKAATGKKPAKSAKAKSAARPKKKKK